MDEKLKTIKVLPGTIQDLNIISAMTGERQYEVVWRLAKTERKEVIKITKPLSEMQKSKTLNQ